MKNRPFNKIFPDIIYPLFSKHDGDPVKYNFTTKLLANMSQLPPMDRTMIWSQTSHLPRTLRNVLIFGSIYANLQQQAFREFLVSPAFISTLNVRKHVGLSHDKCKILTYFL